MFSKVLASPPKLNTDTEQYFSEQVRTKVAAVMQTSYFNLMIDENNTCYHFGESCSERFFKELSSGHTAKKHSYIFVVKI